MATLFWHVALLLTCQGHAQDLVEVQGLTAARPGYPVIDGVKPCYEQVLNVLCVIIDFNETTVPAEGYVTCRPYEDMPPSTPRSVDVMWGQEPYICNTSQVCKVYPSAPRPDTDYHVFCSGYGRWDQSDEVWALPTYPTCITAADGAMDECGVRIRTKAGEGVDMHATFGAQDLAYALLLILYVVWSFFFEHAQFVHETGMAVLGGVVGGVILKMVFNTYVLFSYDLFSFILLPMVIFGAGFNLRKKNFFKYSTYIFSLGVIGTVCTFLMIYFGSSFGTFQAQDGTIFKLDSRVRLIMASVLASTDTVAPMAFLPSEKFPMLFAIVFGEGVLNDVVSILLSTATAGSSALPNAGELLGLVSYYLVTSLFMGVTFGLGISVLYKHFEDLHHHVHKPVTLMVLLNYVCYVTTEMCEFSAIFSLFVCALICGHYGVWSMCKEAQDFSHEFAEVLAYCAEAFVFGYFGLSSVYFIFEGKFSLPLIGFYACCILVARACAVTLMAGLLKAMHCGRTMALKTGELTVICFAGCMRGTIAFALILRAMPPVEQQNELETVLTSTVLGIVLINCLAFGGLFPVVLRCFGLDAASNPGPVEDPVQLTRTESLPGDGPGLMSSASRNSLHKWWHDLDNRIMKPFFRAGVNRDHSNPNLLDSSNMRAVVENGASMQHIYGEEGS